MNAEKYNIIKKCSCLLLLRSNGNFRGGEGAYKSNHNVQYESKQKTVSYFSEQN